MKSKKVKITLTIILALFFNFPLFSQDIEVHLGNKEKVKALEKIESTFLTKDGAIAIKTKSIQFQLLPGTKMLGSTDYSMEVLDKNMNIVSQNELELPDKNLNIVEIAYVNEELYVFMEKYDSKSDLNSLYGTTISNTGEFNQDIFEIVQIRSETKRDANQFEIDLSVDSTQFLITMSPQRSDRNQVAERQFLIINHKFEEIDNIKVDFPFKERDFEIDNKLLDHHGNIHLLCAISIDETRRVNIFNTEAEKEASVFSIYKGQNKIQEYKIDFLNDDAGFISQITMKTDKLGQLQCTGFYSDKKGNSTKGIFVFTIDLETKQIANATSQAFTDEYLNQFLSDRELRKKERKKDKKNNPYDRLYNYKIRDVVMKEGGGFYIVAEFYLLVISTSTSSQGGSQTRFRYYFDDLMVINVESNNEVTWYSRVPKKQYSVDDEGRYLGIVTGINRDNSLNIIFNENKKNASIMSPEKVERVKLKKSTVALVKFDEEGNATKTPLFDNDKSKMYLLPLGASKENKNNLVLYLRAKRSNKFANVILK